MIYPSKLLWAWHQGIRPRHPVAIDTETSGLYVDSGARVSTVSIGWIDYYDEETGSHEWEDFVRGSSGEERLQGMDPSGIWTWGYEEIDRDLAEPVISFAWPFDQDIPGTGKPEDSGQGVMWSETENLPMSEWIALLDWLKLVGEEVGLTMHHAKFDIHQMEHGVRRWPELINIELAQYVDWDTQNVADVVTGMVVPGEKPGSTTTSLKPTSQHLWGEAEGDEKKVIGDYLRKNKLPKGRWDLMPWGIVAKYADQDARLTCRLRVWQEIHGPKIATWFDGKQGRMTFQQAIDRRLATSKMLYRVERRGLPFAVREAYEGAEEIARRQAVLEKQLPFAPATLPMAKHYWFGEGEWRGVTGLGIRPYGTTDSGGAQLDQQIIGKMVEAGIPGAETWRDIQKLATASNRWYEGWAQRAGKDNRLRTSVRQNGTASGRFSVENIQLQAIPHDYRLSGFEILNGIRTPRQLIGDGVPDGYELWELDLAQAELRVAALFAGCRRMLDLIDAGADLHGDAAEQLFDVHPGDPDWGQTRNVAKRANFSLIFGVGWSTLQADIEEQTGIRLSEAEARKLVKDWNALYPEFREAIDHHAKTVMKRYIASGSKKLAHLQMANGERRWFTRNDVEFFNKQTGKIERNSHKAFNQRVQPSLAQYGIDWWLEVESWLMDELGDEFIEFDPREGQDFDYEPKPNEGAVGRIGMVLMIHDSMILLLPKGPRGEELVAGAISRGIRLWDKRFAGVPGGVDAKRWTAKE